MTNSSNFLVRDMLDIIFQYKNRAYGAYQLRRDYPRHLQLAFGGCVLFIGLLATTPRWAARFGMDKPVPEETVVCMCELPNLTPETPPPPPLPPPPPPPPVRATVQFVPPAILRDNEVVEEPPPPIVTELENTAASIGKTNVAGTSNGEPTGIPDDKELDPKVVERVQPEDTKVYNLFDIQKMPSFPGGEAAMHRFVLDNFKRPALASEVAGTIAVSFVVGKDGDIEDIKILRDPGAGLGKEVVRVVRLMPKWLPGEANGNPVKVRFTLPVRLHLQ